MELAFVVYLISILESVSTFLGLLCAIICVAIYGLVAAYFCSSYKFKKTIIFFIVLALLCGTVKALLPSEKQAYVIAAAYGAQEVMHKWEAWCFDYKKRFPDMKYLGDGIYSDSWKVGNKAR